MIYYYSNWFTVAENDECHLIFNGSNSFCLISIFTAEFLFHKLFQVSLTSGVLCSWRNIWKPHLTSIVLTKSKSLLYKLILCIALDKYLFICLITINTGKTYCEDPHDTNPLARIVTKNKCLMLPYSWDYFPTESERNPWGLLYSIRKDTGLSWWDSGWEPAHMGTRVRLPGPGGDPECMWGNKAHAPQLWSSCVQNCESQLLELPAAPLKPMCAWKFVCPQWCRAATVVKPTRHKLENDLVSATGELQQQQRDRATVKNKINKNNL